MKRSIRNQYGSLFAAILLSTCSAAWAAPTVQAQAPNAAGLLRQAQHLSDEESWAEATVAAQAAMEAGRNSDVLDYTELDAGFLLVNLLYKQGRYAEVRNTAEGQIAYWEQQAASFGSKSGRDSRSISMLRLAIEASMMAGERVEVARLQEKLFAVASPAPSLWRLSPDEPRLRYELADLSMPLMLGQWKLTEFEPAHTRDRSMRVRYTQVSADNDMSAEISLSYDELQRMQNAEQRHDWFKSYQGLPTAPAFSLPMPDLSFDGATSVKVERNWECKGEQCTRVHWIAHYGEWVMDVEVNFHSPNKAQAAEEVRKLFAALKWQSAPPLFRERSMAEQNRDMDSYWDVPDGWSKAAELAEQALPDAFFPDEIARQYIYIGVSQYRRGAWDAARSSLDLALSAREYAISSESLYKTALDYAADIAYRQGRNDEAVALNRTLIERQQSDSTLGWGVPDGENALVHRLKGMQLPLRVGDYRLRLDGTNRFFYENLQTETQLGLTVNVAQSSDDGLESLMRKFMAKTFRLQAGDVRRTKFSPRSAEDGEPQVTGRKWEFEVTKLPDEKGAPDEAPFTGVLRKTPIKMAFWIVDRKGQRSLLRAPIMEDGHTEAEANQIAQALSW